MEFLSQTLELKPQKLLLTVGEDLEKEESGVEVGVQISLGALSNKHVLEAEGKEVFDNRRKRKAVELTYWGWV